MQSSRFLEYPLPLFQQIGNVFSAVGIEDGGIRERAPNRVPPVDFAQGHDLADMLPGIQPPFFQLLIVRLGWKKEK
jgi:hypothetical protein